MAFLRRAAQVALSCDFCIFEVAFSCGIEEEHPPLRLIGTVSIGEK